jgi:hypothetical protein
MVQAQSAKQSIPQSKIADSHGDHVKQRDTWFYRGRVIRGQPSAELRRRAYEAKLRMRAQRAASLALGQARGQFSFSSGSWIPLGPAPLASDATGNGTQNYGWVSGRAIAIAIDPADSSGNTVYIGGAQAGIWKSSNAAFATANSVTWTPIADGQATLSLGALAIQPGNSNPANSLILAATGEADDSADSYFGLGILRSTNAGSTWTLASTANGGALSFSGLGGTRMAFSTIQTNTVVAAMATSPEGTVDGAVTAGTTPGLYTSLDAGQTWTYDALADPGGATDATSATSVVYNASANSGAGLFFAAVRYHGFYSSPDGVNWTRLATQPGGAVLSTTACPPQSSSNGYACPVYRGEITVVPGRNEMYAWYIYLSLGAPVDGGIWQSINGGQWTPISDTGIANCGDVEGCGVEQGADNLALLAMPNGDATDLYAGAVNLYKCTISTLNPACAASPFINLTHAYGCDPIAAPAHVHPDQHALAYMIPSSGGDSGNALLYFANDGGIYRALNGYTGLATGSCSGTNQFDDLNQNLGSMTQIVGFSQHPTDDNTLLGGAQGNGSPATNAATTSSSWIDVLGGDGAYNAIDPNTPTNWYASNPDVPPGGLGIQLCSSGINCNDSGFSFVVTSDTLGGDDGGFYFPYILDANSTSAMLVGTCRVWRGPRTGGTFSVLSPNFDTLGSGTCSGSEVNLITALAAAGPADSNGSEVVYATTSGLGPLDGPLNFPTGGHIWVTTDASSGAASFVDTTNNGPQGSINPSQFPVSGVAADPSDTTGQTAYIAVMGFTGGAGHVWKTTNAGASWTDYTANLPDSPANAVAVYPAMSQVFVATDVGVFASSTSTASWTELGPDPAPGDFGFLPNVAVTALNIFDYGGLQLLRASTYGRGVWQFNLVLTPDFGLQISNPSLTVYAGQTGTFNGTASALNGYANSVTLSCIAESTPPPSTCTPSPATLTPANNTPFTVSVGGAPGSYKFAIQASDSNHLAHTFPVTLDLLSIGLTTPSPASVTVPSGTTSSPVGFQVTAAGSFDQSVTVSCSSPITSATCNLTPGTTVNPTSSSPVNMTAAVTVPAGTIVGSYPVTIQATTAGLPVSVTTSFTLVVTSDADFSLTEPTPFPEVDVGSTGVSGPITISASGGFSGTVTLACPQTFGVGSCSISPTSVSSFPATATLTINGVNFTAGSYQLSITGTSGSDGHSLAVPFNVGDYSISGTATLAGSPAGQSIAKLTLTSLFSYAGSINATCGASALAGAQCILSPANPITLTAGGTATVTVTLNIPNNASPGTYPIAINTEDTTGTLPHSATISLSLAQDFVVLCPAAVSLSTCTQTVTAGQTSGAYNLTVQPVGSSFTNPVTLSCPTGLPSGAQCLFTPSTPVTPNSSAVDVVLNISTVAAANAQARGRHVPASILFVLAPAIVLGMLGIFSPQRKRTLLLLLVLPTVFFCFSCSGVSNGGGGGGGGTPQTYQVTVTGTSPGSAPDAGQSVIVTLVVN